MYRVVVRVKSKLLYLELRERREEKEEEEEEAVKGKRKIGKERRRKGKSLSRFLWEALEEENLARLGTPARLDEIRTRHSVQGYPLRQHSATLRAAAAITDRGGGRGGGGLLVEGHRRGRAAQTRIGG